MRQWWNSLILTGTSLSGLGILLLAGCGGGQVNGIANPGPSQTTAVGQGAATFFGQPKPMLTASSGSVTVSALAGATFTAVTVNPAPDYDNTFFAYSRTFGGNSAVYELPYGTGSEQLLTHSVGGPSSPAISKSGYIFYSDANGSYANLMRADGSNNTRLSFSSSSISPQEFIRPSISPDSNHVAFSDGQGLWYAPLTGGVAKLIQSNPGRFGSSFEANNTVIAYVAQAPVGLDNIFTTPVTGGTPSNVTPDTLATKGNWSLPNCSSDGVSIAAVFTPTGSSKSEIIVFAPLTSTYIAITPSAYSDTAPCFSPDGLRIVFYRSSTGGATPGIYIADYSGENQQLVLPDPPNGGSIDYLAWSPYPGAQRLLGVGANLYSENVSGFLLSQSGPVFGGICGFATATPSTATVSSSTAMSAQPLVLTLGGDNITMIEYTNSMFDLHGEALILPSGTTRSALVTVDSFSGGIDTVATVSSVVHQTPSRAAGGNLVYTADFTGIYNGKGKNLAPSGAKQIVVDPTTGKLVSFG